MSYIWHCGSTEFNKLCKISQVLISHEEKPSCLKKLKCLCQQFSNRLWQMTKLVVCKERSESLLQCKKRVTGDWPTSRDTSLHGKCVSEIIKETNMILPNRDPHLIGHMRIDTLIWWRFCQHTVYILISPRTVKRNMDIRESIYCLTKSKARI